LVAFANKKRFSTRRSGTAEVARSEVPHTEIKEIAEFLPSMADCIKVSPVLCRSFPLID